MTDHKGAAKPDEAHAASSGTKHADGEKPVFHKRIEASPVRPAHPPKK